MMNNGWKTVVIDNHVSIGYENGNMLVEGDDKKYIPVSQMKTLIINSSQTRITSHLLTELCTNKVKIILCDHKHNPISEVVGYNDNCQTAGRMKEQVEWKHEEKERMWGKIVISKIKVQNGLLIYLGFGNNALMNNYISEVEPGDPSNREGQAARIYFNTIFGKGFIRNSENDLNAMLNYGYTILLSAFNRVVTAYGYHTALGMKHCSTFNPYNLSSDLMEPFRPFVDMIALRNINKALDQNTKKQLIEMTYKKMIFGGKKMELQVALEAYINQIMKNMGNKDYLIPSIGFADER